MPTSSSQKELEKSILDAGAEFVEYTKDGKGKVFHMKKKIKLRGGKTNDLEIRIMPGTFDGPHRGARTIFTNAKTGEYVYPNGQQITGTPTASQRKAIGHIQPQVP